MRSSVEDDLDAEKALILAEKTALDRRLEEIEIARKVLSEIRERGHKVKRAESKRVGTPTPKRAKAKPRTAKAGPPPAASAAPVATNMADVVRAAIFAQTDEFTTTKVGDYIRKHHPDVYERLPTSYISTLLWRLCSTKKVLLVRRGESGQANTYALPPKK
jgi:hypothetical protein